MMAMWKGVTFCPALLRSSLLKHVYIFGLVRVPERIQKIGRVAGRRPFGWLKCSSYFHTVCHGISPKWLPALYNKSCFSCWPYHICMLGNSSMGARTVIVLLGLVLRTLIDITHFSDLKHSHGCASLEQRRKEPTPPPPINLSRHPLIKRTNHENYQHHSLLSVFILSILLLVCSHRNTGGINATRKKGPKKNSNYKNEYHKSDVTTLNQWPSVP